MKVMVIGAFKPVGGEFPISPFSSGFCPIRFLHYKNMNEIS